MDLRGMHVALEDETKTLLFFHIVRSWYTIPTFVVVVAVELACGRTQIRIQGGKVWFCQNLSTMFSMGRYESFAWGSLLVNLI